MRRIIILLFICVTINCCDKLFSAGRGTLRIISALGNRYSVLEFNKKQLDPDEFCPVPTNWGNNRIPLILSQATYFYVSQLNNTNQEQRIKTKLIYLTESQSWFLALDSFSLFLAP